MSCCFGPSTEVNSEEINANKYINKQLKEDVKQKENNVKVLLLGPASSGKSTVFKQAISLYGSGFDDDDRRSYLPLIHTSLISAFRILITNANKFGTLSPNLTSARLSVSSLSEDSIIPSSITPSFQLLWSDPLIQKCWDQHTVFHLPECIQYFMDKIVDITTPGYIPNQADLLRVRAPTSGIIETQLKTIDGTLTIVDVGGQRSERRKWIHCFECVRAVIFVAAISEYDQQLEEDQSQNRLVESFELFDEIVNSKYFADTSLILFLNKSDLLAEKLQRVPFSSIFHKYRGPNEFEPVVAWLKRKFEARNQDEHRKIYVHITCAINPDNFKLVFEAVRETVQIATLKTLNLI